MHQHYLGAHAAYRARTFQESHPDPARARRIRVIHSLSRQTPLLNNLPPFKAIDQSLPAFQRGHPSDERTPHKFH